MERFVEEYYGMPVTLDSLTWVASTDDLWKAAKAFERGEPDIRLEVTVHYEHVHRGFTHVVYAEDGTDGDGGRYIVLRGSFDSFGTGRLLLVRLTPELIESNRPYMGHFCLDLPDRTTAKPDYAALVSSYREMLCSASMSGLDRA